MTMHHCVMHAVPLMAGGSLRRALDTGRVAAFTDGPACSHRLALTWAARLHIAAQVAEGLIYLHQVFLGVCCSFSPPCCWRLSNMSKRKVSEMWLLCRRV